MNLCYASYRYFADGKVTEPIAESDPANMAYALGGSYLSFYTLKSLSDRQLALRLEPYDWVIVALDVEAMELVRRIVEVCAGRAATYSEGHVADYQRLSPAGQMSFVRAARAARVNFLYWEKYIPFYRALTPAPVAYLPYPYQLGEASRQRVPVEQRPALAALPSGLAGATRNGLASWTVARKLLRDGLIDKAAGWLERGTFLEDAHALRYFLRDQLAPPAIAPRGWDWRKWLILLRIDFRPFLRLHRRLPGRAQKATVPQSLDMDDITVYARQGWPQYIRQLAPARLMIELNNRETVGRNALDCAALGIPYVSTTRSDLAARLFPETVVADSWDVDGAVQICKRLLADAAFYQRVTAYASEAVQEYDMARFQAHFSRLAAQFPSLLPPSTACDSVMERTSRVLSGSIAGALQLLVAMALQIVLMPLILRLAGQEVLGVYAIVLQVIGYLSLLDFGLYTAMTRSLSQATQEPARFGALLRVGLLFLGLAGGIYAAAGAGLALALPGLFHLSGALADQARLALLILAGWGLLRFPLGLFGTALLAIQDLTLPPLLGLAANVVRMVLAILAVLSGWGIIGLSVASIIGEALLYAVLALRFMRLRRGWFQLRGRFERALLVEQVRFGLRAFWGNLAGRVVFFSDNLVVGNLYGAAATSVYYNTQMPMAVAYSLIYRLADNASPGINELWAHKDRERLRDIFLRLQRLTLLAVAPVVVGGWFYLRAVIDVWVGPAQYGGPLMTLWLVLFAGLATARYVPQVFLYATGDLRRWSQIVSLEAAGNLALSFWWGSRLGLHGVALATLVAALPTSIYLQWRARRDLDFSWRDWIVETLLPAAVAALPMTAAAWLLSSLAQPASWLALALHMGILAAVHAGSSYLVGLKAADREAVKHLIARRRVRKGND